ncbi:Os06g0107600 [Oryza sativa Japonica Group]|uniref:WAT1-related protein n=2 Tax=Oryza sativa subsp. japonica TaxID=39947 RepID=A0A0P0WRC0_ORYSJ|nr:nodulin MtN21-like [Oryza sativa Japonica Group]BAD67719.1 nodulin MtN21-like [Oryza sativa Japonica Group]BAG98104.1 unnamed protein product [Oryza sativa Japonica Group]BAS95762.1 Os06g0107600 [Oryza sativa Japonica Group]
MGWWLGGGLPVIAMLALNVVAAVLVSLVKVAMDGGLNPLVLVTLQQLTAAIFLGPIAYFKERKSRPKLTLEIFTYLFVSAALGAALRQYMIFVALRYTTATFVTAFSNIAPVLTFLLAILTRITEPEEKDRHCKACGHADISSRSHGADILQGRGCHPHNQDPPCNSSSSSSSRSSHEQQELDAGHGGHPGQLRVPLLLVPPPQQARQEVPPCLLLQCLHVHVQLPPGGRRRPLHTTQRLRLDRQDQVPHTHHPLRRCGGVWPFVCATDMVHREARSSVRRSLHSGGADHCFSD